MNLQQKRYPFVTVTYSMTESFVRVEEKRLLSSKSFEIPLPDIGATVSTVRQFPLGWLLISLSASLAVLACAVALVTGYGEPLGMGACLLMSGVFSALAWHAFGERKIDLGTVKRGHGVTLDSAGNGNMRDSKLAVAGARDSWSRDRSRLRDRRAGVHANRS